MEKKPYWKLFLSTLTLSAFTFGGGYVIVPLMRKKFTQQLGWISEEEMLELVAIGQSSPGAVAINSATLVGYRIAGFPGALCALAGTVLPPLVILSLVSVFYEFVRDNTYVAAALRGMQAGVAAVIADVVFTMARPYCKKKEWPSFCIMIVAFLLAWLLDVNVAFIILGSGALGAVWSLIAKRRKGADA